MAYTLTRAYSGAKTGSETNTQFTVLPGSSGLMIECAAATFITDEVEPGDGAVVASSTSNNGTHLITAVISETIIVVDYAGTTEAGAGTLRVDAAQHNLLIEDEATVDWDDIVTNVAEPAIVSRKRCSAQETGAGPTATPGMKYFMIRNTIISIIIDNPGAGIETVFTSAREVVYRPGHSSLTVAQGGWQIQHLSTHDGTLVLQLGELSTASDSKSVRNGCVYLGFFFSVDSAEVTFLCYGSFLANPTTSFQFPFPPGPTGAGPGQVFQTILDGACTVPTGGGTDGVDIDGLVNISSGSGFAPQNTVNILSFLQAQSVSVGALVFVSGAEVKNFALSDDAATPAISLILSTGDFIDPVDDPAFSDLMTVGITSTGSKAYTWTPTFMTINDKDSTRKGTIEPVSGVYVEAEYVEITRVVLVGSASPDTDGDYTVTINGTDFTYASVSQSSGGIAAQLVTLINAGAEPVTATAVKHGTDFGLSIEPDDIHTPFTVEVSSPSTMSLKSNTASVTGFPATTAADGTIGEKVIEVASQVDVGGQKEALLTKMLRYMISHPHYAPFRKQIYLTRKTTETVFVEINTDDIENNEVSPGVL